MKELSKSYPALKEAVLDRAYYAKTHEPKFADSTAKSIDAAAEQVLSEVKDILTHWKAEQKK
jgi:hypothetical protein